MHTRKSLLPFVLSLTLLGCSGGAATAKPFPGFSWREFQDGRGMAGPGYTRFGDVSGRAVRLPFERALAGEARAVAAFFDLKLQTDGEHSFTHQRMTLLLLASLGDRAFCRHLSQRAPLVQWRVSQGLRWEADDPDYLAVFRARYPRTLALTHRWGRVPWRECVGITLRSRRDPPAA